MSIIRPQLNKIQRVRLQANLDSTMESSSKASRLLFGEMKNLSSVLAKSVVQLRTAPLDEFHDKQPLLDRELNNLGAFVDTLAQGLENLKNQSTIVREILESGTAGDALDVTKALEELDLEDAKIEEAKRSSDNGHSNGTNGNTNGGKTNGNSNGNTNGNTNGGTNGDTNGEDLSALYIDPLKWAPEFPKLKGGSPQQCFVSHIVNPSDFYIHPNANTNEFCLEIQREQNKLIAKGIIGLPEVKTAMYCCARYAEDTYWYRARIIDIIHANGNPGIIEKVKVFYLDYGNSAEVTLDDLMPLAASIAQIPVKAVNCHLALYDPYNGWPAEATEEMKKKIGFAKVKVTFNKESPRISDLGSFPFYPVDLCLKDNINVFECLRKFIAGSAN